MTTTLGFESEVVVIIIVIYLKTWISSTQSRDIYKNGEPWEYEVFIEK